MSKIERWKKIFRNVQGKSVFVSLNHKLEQLTQTQAYRLNDLLQGSRSAAESDSGSKHKKARYTFSEASELLSVSEKSLLEKGSSGAIEFFVDGAGLYGHWQSGGPEISFESTPIKLESGYLLVAPKFCDKIGVFGSVNISVLQLPEHQEPTTLDLDSDTLERLEALGPGDKYFYLSELFRVDPMKLVLVAPLPRIGQ